MDDDPAVGEPAGRPILDPFDPVDAADLVLVAIVSAPRCRTLAVAADTTWCLSTARTRSG
jgi:hypothetical protein